MSTLTERARTVVSRSRREQLEANPRPNRQSKQQKLNACHRSAEADRGEVPARAGSQKQALKKQADESVTRASFQFAKERIGLPTQNSRLERQMEKKTANELGDGQEFDGPGATDASATTWFSGTKGETVRTCP